MLLAAGAFLLDKTYMRRGVSDRVRSSDSHEAHGRGAPAVESLEDQDSDLKPTVAPKDVIDTIAELDEKALGRAVARAARQEDPTKLMLTTIQAAISVTQVLIPLISGCQ